MHVLTLSISSLLNMESDHGDRYCEVVQSDQGLWVYSAGWRRRQGRIRSYFGGRRAGLSTLNEGQKVDYEIVSDRGKSAGNLKVK